MTASRSSTRGTRCHARPPARAHRPRTLVRSPCVAAGRAPARCAGPLVERVGWGNWFARAQRTTQSTRVEWAGQPIYLGRNDLGMRPHRARDRTPGLPAQHPRRIDRRQVVLQNGRSHRHNDRAAAAGMGPSGLAPPRATAPHPGWSVLQRCARTETRRGAPSRARRTTHVLAHVGVRRDRGSAAPKPEPQRLGHAGMCRSASSRSGALEPMPTVPRRELRRPFCAVRGFSDASVRFLESRVEEMPATLPPAPVPPNARFDVRIKPTYTVGIVRHGRRRAPPARPGQPKHGASASLCIHNQSRSLTTIQLSGAVVSVPGP